MGNWRSQWRVSIAANSHPAGSDSAHTNALSEATRDYDYVIAVGDYNLKQRSPIYQDLTNRFQNSWAVINPTLSGKRHPDIGVIEPSSTELINMTNRIDHIFVSRNFKVEEAYYLPAPESMTDHPIHWAVLSWGE